MFQRRILLTAVAILVSVNSARAGLYYSGEAIAELPSQWRGFLLDQRTLRNIAVKPGPGSAANPAREKYEDAAAKLEKASRERKLSADEMADLGALYVRLGEIAKAVEVLRGGHRDHPQHFRIVSNLGTASTIEGVRIDELARDQTAAQILDLNRQKLRAMTAADDLVEALFVNTDAMGNPVEGAPARGSRAWYRRQNLDDRMVEVNHATALGDIFLDIGRSVPRAVRQLIVGLLADDLSGRYGHYVIKYVGQVNDDGHIVLSGRIMDGQDQLGELTIHARFDDHRGLVVSRWLEGAGGESRRAAGSVAEDRHLEPADAAGQVERLLVARP